MDKNLKILDKLSEKPFKVGVTDHSFESYIELRKNKELVTKYEIVYHNMPKYWIRKALMNSLIAILNNSGIVPSTIAYLIPDNKCGGDFFKFELNFGQCQFIPAQEYGMMVVPFLTSEYINFYDMRYHKVPLIHSEDTVHEVELQHEWIRKIIL